MAWHTVLKHYVKNAIACFSLFRKVGLFFRFIQTSSTILCVHINYPIFIITIQYMDENGIYVHTYYSYSTAQHIYLIY